MFQAATVQCEECETTCEQLSKTLWTSWAAARAKVGSMKYCIPAELASWGFLAAPMALTSRMTTLLTYNITSGLLSATGKSHLMDAPNMRIVKKAIN